MAGPAWLLGAAALTLLMGGGNRSPTGLSTGSTLLTDINGSPASFARGMYAIVSAVWPQWSTNARLLAVTHAAYESGWGQVGQHRDLTNNVWDLTAGSDWYGPVVEGTTPDGGVLQRWRSYPDLESASIDYAMFLGLYDSAALAELYGAANPSTFAADLGASRFYDTRLVPVSTYAANLVSMVRSVATYVGVG